MCGAPFAWAAFSVVLLGLLVAGYQALNPIGRIQKITDGAVVI